LNDGIPPQVRLSILVATRNRATLLERMLASLDRAMAGTAIEVEVIVADNGSTDDTWSRLQRWAASRPRCTAFLAPDPGKARALNLLLQRAQAPLLVFTDDDVEVDENWIESVHAFFQSHPEFAAATGRVRTPPAVRDPELLARVALFGTLPLYDRGNEVGDTRHLYGCNMAIRRGALDRVGRFHEQLGPGASGLHEDGDIARRILAAGLRIGFMPGAIVYHAVEPDRLTFEFFREMHRRDARSRFVLDPNRSLVRTLLDCAGAALTLLWNGLTRDQRRRMRARGRLISHLEMLRLVHARSAG